MKKIIIAISTILLSFSLNAVCQSTVKLAPGTEVILYEIVKEKDGVTLKFIDNISKAKGYDNQPSFAPDSKSVLFVSARDGEQMDIYQYHIEAKKIEQLTNTPENEFSPMMEKRMNSFTAVREGGEPFQSVHRYPYKQPQNVKSEWAVSSQTPIGYYAFNENGIAVGWARWANSIYIFKPNEEFATFVVGHALPSKPLLIPNTGTFSFVHRQADDLAWIKSIDVTSRAVTPIAPIFSGNIDYAWTAEGVLLSGKESQLHYWDTKNQLWKFWADLSRDNIFDISRLAVSPDNRYLAVVAKVPE